MACSCYIVTGIRQKDNQGRPIPAINELNHMKKLIRTTAGATMREQEDASFPDIHPDVFVNSWDREELIQQVMNIRFELKILKPNGTGIMSLEETRQAIAEAIAEHSERERRCLRKFYGPSQIFADQEEMRSSFTRPKMKKG